MTNRSFAQHAVDRLGKILLLRRVFREEDILLINQLKNCKTVLDLGCGKDSVVKKTRNITFSLGVDISKKDLEISKKKKIHTKYLLKDIGKLVLPPKSFDAVLLIGVLEHLKKSEGIRILKKSEKWAAKKVIVSVPNGESYQEESKENSFQKHISEWHSNDFSKNGFSVKGTTGLKIMYKDKQTTYYSKKRDKYLLDNIRFRPKFLFFLLNALSEIVIYYFPAHAKTLFAVKNFQK